MVEKNKSDNRRIIPYDHTSVSILLPAWLIFNKNIRAKGQNRS